jgi:hypothetical protein
MGTNSSQYVYQYGRKSEDGHMYRNNGPLSRSSNTDYGKVLSDSRELYEQISQAHTDLMTLVLRKAGLSDYSDMFRLKNGQIMALCDEIAEQYFSLGDAFDKEALSNLIYNVANECSDANSKAIRENINR